MKANARHYDSIELRDNMLSYDGIKLTTDDLKIRSIKTLASKLGIKRLTALVFSEITSKAIKSIPTGDEIEKATPKETIEMVDRTIKTVTEIETSFTDIADKKNQTKDEFSLRELRGFDKAMQTTILDINYVDFLQFQRYFIPQAELEEAFIYIIHKPIYFSIDFSHRLKT